MTSRSALRYPLRGFVATCALAVTFAALAGEVTLAFKSRDGSDVSATVDAQVRGLLQPQQMPALMTEPAPALKASAPAEAR
jgi:hypothetical protein